MKRKTKQQRINQGMQLLNSTFNIKTNVVKINTHNTLEHEQAKLAKTYELMKEGYTVITEAIFKNGSRGDIFVPEKFLIIEILHSETEQMAKKKVEKYPEQCDIIFIKTSDII